MKRYRPLTCAVSVLYLLLSALWASAETNSVPERTGQAGFQPRSKLGGPTSVPAQLEEDDQLTEPLFRFQQSDDFFQPWFDWKGAIDDRHGLRLGVAYTAVYLGASDTLPGNEEQGSTGIFRISGRWDLINKDKKNEGTLVFSVDHRHRLGTDVSASNLGWELGYNGIPATLFSDLNLVLIDLNWQQFLNDGKTGFVFGRYDPNDFLDVVGYANPWTTFLNLAVSFNTSVALPAAMFGVGGGHWLTDQVSIGGTINDANGSETTGSFEEGAEFYKAVETGWAPSRDDRYYKKLHVMAWHVDERENAGVDDGWGMTVGANWTFNKRWMPFLKAGVSEGTASLANASVSFGAIYKFFNSSDLVGLGVNWSQPSGTTLRDEEQWSNELFYRIQIGPNMAITPSVQLLVNPANNPDNDTIWIGGLRVRLAL